MADTANIKINGKTFTGVSSINVADATAGATTPVTFVLSSGSSISTSVSFAEVPTIRVTTNVPTPSVATISTSVSVE